VPAGGNTITMDNTGSSNAVIRNTSGMPASLSIARRASP
jgi:hypothetical protein